MFTTVAEPDETLVSLNEFADVWATHERSYARLALAVARFESSGEFGVDGAVTIAAWLRDHCRMTDNDAACLVRDARFLHKFQPVADAAVDGVLSLGLVRTLKASVSRATECVFAECADEQVAAVSSLSVRDAREVCAEWRQRAEAIIKLPEPSVPDRQLSCSRASDGSLVGRFVFDPALAAQFEQALGNSITWEGADDTRTVAARQGDAMFDIFSFFNANHTKDGTPRHRPHVELSIDAERLGDANCCATNSDGILFPGSSADALMCDSMIQRFVMNGSVPVDIGNTTRSVPINIFRAVAKRDGGCRHPGCERKIAWCEAHHIRFWRHGGTTGLSNLVLLCSRHHHLVHRPGWELKLLPDGTVEVTNPSGITRTSHPKPRGSNRLKHLTPDRP